MRHRHFRKFGSLISLLVTIVLVCLPLLATPRPTQAATITVNTTADNGPDNCITICTLRDAIAVISLNLAHGTSNSLTAKLHDAEMALNRGNVQTAINKLREFISAVEAQHGKKLTDTQANQLIEQANIVINQLSGAAPVLAPTFVPKR